MRRCMEIHRVNLPPSLMDILELIMHVTLNFMGITTIMLTANITMSSRFTFNILHVLNRFSIPAHHESDYILVTLAGAVIVNIRLTATLTMR